MITVDRPSASRLELRTDSTQSLCRAAVAQKPNNLRVAFLTNEIPPYRVPKYQELAATPGWEFKVLTCVDREWDRSWTVGNSLPFAVRRSWSFSYQRKRRHRGAAEFEDRRQVHVPLSLPWDLWRFSPDVIISAEFGARTLIAAAYARLFRRRLYVYFEGTPHTERGINGMQKRLRGVIRRLADAFFVNGGQGRVYLEQLGIAPEKIVEIGQAIDTDLFAAPLSAEEREAERRRLEIRGHCYVFCGRLIPLKGLDHLLDAWETFSRLDGVEATLLFIGDGSQRAQLERRAIDAGLTNVRFLGSVPRSDLPRLYQAADVFVLPSLNDCWALVVEEAMASGLPVISSIYNGGVERITEGEAGWTVDPLDKNQFVQKLQLAWEARGQGEAIAKAARGASAQNRIAAVAERIRNAVNCRRTS